MKPWLLPTITLSHLLWPRLQEIQGELCPDLSVQQLYRISTMYWDDKYNTETVSGEVLQQMRTLMQARPPLSLFLGFPFLCTC